MKKKRDQAIIALMACLILAPLMLGNATASIKQSTELNGIYTTWNLQCVIDLRWELVEDASYYNVYRYDDGIGDFVKINAEAITSYRYIDRDIVCGEAYQYKVGVVFDDAEEFSPPVIVSMDDPDPYQRSVLLEADASTPKVGDTIEFYWVYGQEGSDKKAADINVSAYINPQNLSSQVTFWDFSNIPASYLYKEEITSVVALDQSPQADYLPYLFNDPDYILKIDIPDNDDRDYSFHGNDSQQQALYGYILGENLPSQKLITLYEESYEQSLLFPTDYNMSWSNFVVGEIQQPAGEYSADFVANTYKKILSEGKIRLNLESKGLVDYPCLLYQFRTDLYTMLPNMEYQWIVPGIGPAVRIRSDVGESDPYFRFANRVWFLKDMNLNLSNPEGLTIDEIGTEIVSVHWSPNSESHLVGYRVYYGDQPQIDQREYVDVTQTSAELSGLASDTLYFIAVAARDNKGSLSNPSVDVIAHTLAAPTPTPTATPTITATPTNTPTPQLEFTPIAKPPKVIIYLAGYMETFITAEAGGNMSLLVYAATEELVAADSVEFYLDGNPTGEMVPVLDPAMGIFGMYQVPVEPGIAPGSTLIQYMAKKDEQPSDLWPYLNVGE